MTLLLTEGFDGYDAPGSSGSLPAAWVDGKWEAASLSCTFETTNGLHGKFGRRTSSSTGIMFKKILAAADEDDVLIFGGAIYLDGPTAGYDLVGFKGDAGVSEHVIITIDTNSRVNAYRNFTTPTLLGTSTATVPRDAWVYFEAKVKLHDTTGTVDVRIDETSVLSLTGQDTKSGGTDAVFDAIEVYGHGTGGSHLRWDDIYLCNEQGPTNNDFLGAVVVEALGPNGNGNSSQFVGSDGNSTDNYLLVDDGAVNGTVDDSGADYVESDTDNNKDTYTFENSAYGTPQSIFGVMAYAKARRSDTGARTLALVARLSGTEVDSADKSLNTSSGNFGWVFHAFETKPGGGAWTFTDLNAAEFGVKARP